MRVGVQMVFQSWGYGDEVTDGDVVEQEIRLGELADELGFHALWPVEHHFRRLLVLSRQHGVPRPHGGADEAHPARHRRGDPAVERAAPRREKIALLDHLSNGRVLFGMGRGLARCEYEGFGIPMDESRDRFDEAARMILDALETG